MPLKALKSSAIFNAKNLVGWRSDRKIVVFSVDDYGNVRLDSKAARDQMEKAGLRVRTRFDAYDTLETKEDLEALFEVLTSVKDGNNNPAVFTPFAVPCNINFEKTTKNGYSEFYNELLPKTFEKLAVQQSKAYKGTWNLLQEGIEKGLIVPQFHGREHLNLKVFKEKLAKKDHEVITALKNRSYSSISSSDYSTISPMAAFEFWDIMENERFDAIIKDGLDAFESVYGYRAEHFNPPGGREHPSIHKTLKDHGVQYLDTPLLKREHQGKGKYRTIFNYTGKRNRYDQTFLVRNVIFEPTHDRGISWVPYALKQIEVAFRWNRPAIVSSHRVNFCGHIDEENRKEGLSALKELLKKITDRWPDVEFMAANELGALIDKKQH